MGETRNITSHSVSPHSDSTAKAVQARASLRRPIFNPYDRFTQPEFDAWIGDITSALKRALNHEGDPEVDQASRHSSHWNTIPDQIGGSIRAEGRAHSPASSDVCDEESTLEDSFAQIASRRAKGKARDPREGPGLGLKGQPIELLTDSEEEEVVDSLEGGGVSSDDSHDGAGEGSSGETDYAESGEEEGEEANPGQPGTSAQHIVAFLSSEDSDHDQDISDHSDNEGRHTGVKSLGNFQVFREDQVNGNGGFAELGERTDDEFPIPSQSAAVFDVELADPWDGPRTYAEDYYSGGDRLAPGLTPNHLTPSPAPPFLPELPNVANAGTDEDRHSPSPSVLSAPSSRKPQDTAGGDEIDEVPQQGAIVAASVNDQKDVEPVAESHHDHDHAEVARVAVHTVEDTEIEAAKTAQGVTSAKTRVISEEISTSYPLEDNLGTKSRDSERAHEIICVSLPDDEHTDADGEDGEGPPGVGTSDLHIRDNWYGADRRNDIGDTSEEDELQESVSSQTVGDVPKTTTSTLSRFSEAINPGGLNAPLVDPSILGTTFQLADADSFGDLPVSSPPSEPPSPVPGQLPGAFELQRQSIEQLIADLEREASEKRSQASESPGSLARQSEVESPNTWASQELENILSGEISVPDSVAGVSDPALTEHSPHQEIELSTHYPGYVVEEAMLETQAPLPDDDFGDTRSVPPPDLAGVVEMIQLYEVEEPKTDGRLTEEPEITINSPRDDGTIVPPLIVSVDSTTPPITSEQRVLSAPTTQGLFHPSVASDASKADLYTAIQHIPAPIVADPSVPDPVPGGSSPPSPGSPHAPELSVGPPAVLRAFDLDTSQKSSGLFTPAQMSEGGTPIQLEDEAIEVLTIPHNAVAKGLANPSIPLRATGDSPSIKHLITGDKDGCKAKDSAAMGADDLIELSQLVSPNEHHLRIGAVDVDAQNPSPGADTADEASLPGRGSNPLNGFPEHPDVLDPSSEQLGTSGVVMGDEDADGEADPDYSPVNGARKIYQGHTHKPTKPTDEDPEVVHSIISDDVLIHKEGAPGEENLNLPVSSSVREQEPEAVGEASSGPLDHISPSLQGNPLAESGDASDKGDFNTFAQSEAKASNGVEHKTQALKRKRRGPDPGLTRVTRSKSGVGVKRRKKGPISSSGGLVVVPENAQSERVDASVDAGSVDDGASESASVSSGTSAVNRLLHATSRAGSVVSSASGDAPWISHPISGVGSVIPLIHSHGLHYHGRLVPPPAVRPTLSTDPHQGIQSEQAKQKSPTPITAPSSPSSKRVPNLNSPVTRSNCRFHKISLPRGEDGARAYFVVPGCALGDGELMEGEDIRDEGSSTHEDHKRMLSNVETLDLSPYLVGVLRKLVGVDLLREQQEIFYLPSGEEKPRKRRPAGALESLRQFRRQSISSGGPLAREHSPRPSELSQGRGTPSRSASGSAMSGSVLEENVVQSEDGDSILSYLDNDDPGEAPPAMRSAVEIGPPLENSLDDGDLDTSAVMERPALAPNRPSTKRRSKRKPLNHDAAAYKPTEDEVKDDEVEERKKRRSSTRRATKRSRTMEESSSVPKSKKARLGRSISAAGAGAMDS